MKKVTIFLMVSGFFVYHFAFSQCTPDNQYATSPMGVYPPCDSIQDTLFNGVPYLLTLTVVVPATYLGCTIDSIVLTGGVTGMPTGLSYTCNPTNCKWLGGNLGCADISGTPTVNGVYNVAADVTIYTGGTFPCGSDVPYSFPYCSLVVVTPTSIYENETKNLNSLTILNNSTDPKNQWVSLKVYSPAQQPASLNVHDLLGRLVFTEPLGLSKGINEIGYSVETIPQGLYLYSVETAGGRVTQKMSVVK